MWAQRRDFVQFSFNSDRQTAIQYQARFKLVVCIPSEWQDLVELRVSLCTKNNTIGESRLETGDLYIQQLWRGNKSQKSRQGFRIGMCWGCIQTFVQGHICLLLQIDAFHCHQPTEGRKKGPPSFVFPIF